MLFCLFIFVLLLWPIESSADTYTAMVGQTILLPCSYVTPIHKPVPICWGRGICPLTQCNEQLLLTDGQNVIYQKEKRYRLKGVLAQGNVSLTIENVREADSGSYCCRIQFPGLFNDQKTSLELLVEPAKTTTYKPQLHETSRNTQPNITGCDSILEDGFTYITEIPEITSPANELQKFEDTIHIGIYLGVCIFMVLVLTLVLATLIFKRHSYTKKKLQESSVISMSNPFPKTEERMRAEENIYTIEEDIYEI
ncbi:hepatitis A virus cellular receptor 2 homolog isoform X1 [Sarcophilus harrisii]|uniref:Hepatitis A virus cellular receptor 2 n=1 Tax=Sarcophilus harrisii TaxID=9305 RepID=A0A1Z1GHY8_SARHA|nr:hepatitis A virus cellular receptor 2 homolog isoform X1 [Sarcophilus harrisii]ARV91002.1 hepatitis A virus cellular receptor 2 [Sarcophilus harrisii]